MLIIASLDACQVLLANGYSRSLDETRQVGIIAGMSSTISCPTCGRPVLIADDDRPKSFPFCSARCRDRDLLQWLGEGYRIPAGPAERDEENSPPPGLDSANDAD